MPTTDNRSGHNGAAVRDRPAAHRGTQPSSPLTPKIWRVVGYVEQCFAQPLTLHRVAAIVGLHPDYLSRRFKREQGVGFHEYLLTIRLRRATTLLVTSTTSIKEISYDVGFRSPEVFSKAFKRFMGCSPVTYRLHNLPAHDPGPAPTLRPLQPAAPPNSTDHGDRADLFDQVAECWEDL